jgi:hypothetical protein
MDQRVLASPHGFSQRATSFIASWCQGIHRMPFCRSIIPHHALNIEHIQNIAHHKQEPSISFSQQPPFSKPAARNSQFSKLQQSSQNPIAFDRIWQMRSATTWSSHHALLGCVTCFLNTQTFARHCFTAINRSTGQTTHAQTPGLDHSNTRTQMHQNLFTLTKNKMLPNN